MAATIEQLDKEILEDLLANLENDLQRAVSVRDDADDKVRLLEEKIARVQAVVAVYANPNLADKTETGRARKGASERLITEFLQNKNGTGATLNEISVATGTKSGTARRVLQLLRDNAKTIQTGDVWKWAPPKDLSAANGTEKGAAK